MARRALGCLVPLIVVAGSRNLVAQCPNGSPPPCPSSPGRGTPAPARHSVAVLYFDNLSPDTADAYLADGLTEEITSRLGELPQLQIKRPSRDAVRRLRDTVPDYLVVLGRLLRVRYLVEGSVRRAGTQVRVSARLLGASDGFRVWSAEYDRSASDLLGLQGDLAQQVATSIAGRLTPAERAHLTSRPTGNAEAYEHFLRGNYLLGQRNPAAAARAIEEYRTALRIDPGFGRALGRVAYAYALFLQWGWEYPDIPSDSLLARGLRAVADGLARDSTVSDTWMALAYLRQAEHPRTLAGVSEAYERAIRLDRFNTEALHQYGSALAQLERDSLASAVMQQALAIEPQRPVTLVELSYIADINGRPLEALRWADSAVAMDPSFFFSFQQRAFVRLELGDSAGARRDGTTAIQLGDVDFSHGVLALLDAASGDTVSARARVERLRAAVQHRDRPTVFENSALAMALIGVGDTSGALTALEQAQPRGAFLWYSLRAILNVVHLPSSPRLNRLIQESRPP
jgi:TolB-like protein/Flp pilus assembly protein TadD